MANKQMLKLVTLSVFAVTVGTGISDAYAIPPTPPTSITGEVSGNLVVLNWAPSTDDVAVAGYNVYRNNNYLATVSETSWSGELLNDNENSFYITAFDSADDNSAREYSTRSETLTLTAEVEVVEPTPEPEPTPQPEPIPEPEPTPLPEPTPEPLPAIPSAPLDLAAARVSPNDIRLSWTASLDDEGVAGYNVYRDGQYITTVFESPTLDVGLTEGQAYTYYLVAFDDPRNFSERSAEVLSAAEPMDPIVPEPDPEPNPDPIPTPESMQPAIDDTTPPEVITNLQIELVTETSVTLVWNEPFDDIGVDGYNLYRNGEYLATVRDLTYTDTNLPTGVADVDYSIASFDDAQNFSETSLPRNVRLGGEPLSDLPAPTGMSSRLVSNEWVEFNWDPVPEAVAYNIYRDSVYLYTVDPLKPRNGDQKYWATSSYIDCNFTRYLACFEQGPEAGGFYEYTVRAVDIEGLESEASAKLSVQLPSNESTDIRSLIDSDFELVFSDEFDGDTLDSNKWNTRLPWGPDVTINGELQYFIDTQNNPDFGHDPFIMTGDTLAITPIVTPDETLEDANNKPFLSGAITSRESFNMTYGYVEARLKVSSGIGKLSTFFLFHQWAALNAPEIDILEFLGEFPEVSYQTYHYRDERDGVTTRSSPTMFQVNEGVPYDDDYHVFSVLWDPELVVWFIDDVEILRLSGPEVSRQAMYITAYLVLGSVWTPRPDPLSEDFFVPYEIDWIRAWQRPEFIR